ncbi:MAG: sodium:calcium antiporter, partial [Bacilli bacterium]|nr:sodium:calcium antiporter [Bacilli bacterium]
TFVVIGVSAIFTPLVVTKNMQKYDLPILAGIYVLLALFAFVITPGTIQTWEAVILFSLTIIYTIFLIYREKKENQVEEEKEEKKRPWWLNLIFVIIGLAGIIIGGDFVVDGATEVAKALGMSEMLIGLTIVAVGTSLPELVTSIVAARKGENDIAVGNAIGSCIFNVVLILGFCSILEPASVNTHPFYALFDVGVMMLTVVLLFIFSIKKREINKWHGIITIALYAIYLTVIILRDTGVL